MEYQKLLNSQEIENIYVAEGDIVSFYNLDGKLCTKDFQGNVKILEDRIVVLEGQLKNTSAIIEEINNIIGD